MKCRHVLSLLESYHDGELGRRRADRVRAHLAACSSCARQLAALEAESNLFRRYLEGLEGELRLQPEVWERLSAAMGEVGVRRRAGRLAGSFARLPLPSARQLALVATVAVISVAATLVAVRFYPWSGTGPSGKPEISQRVPQHGAGGQGSLESALASIRRAEQEYQQAIRILSEIVEKRKASLDAAAVAEFERNLRAIDEAIEATRAAYYARPSDPDLALFMLAAYGRKVELLQELAS